MKTLSIRNAKAVKELANQIAEKLVQELVNKNIGEFIQIQVLGNEFFDDEIALHQTSCEIDFSKKEPTVGEIKYRYYPTMIGPYTSSKISEDFRLKMASFVHDKEVDSITGVSDEKRVNSDLENLQSTGFRPYRLVRMIGEIARGVTAGEYPTLEQLSSAVREVREYAAEGGQEISTGDVITEVSNAMNGNLNVDPARMEEPPRARVVDPPLNGIIEDTPPPTPEIRVSEIDGPIGEDPEPEEIITINGELINFVGYSIHPAYIGYINDEDRDFLIENAHRFGQSGPFIRNAVDMHNRRELENMEERETGSSVPEEMVEIDLEIVDDEIIDTAEPTEIFEMSGAEEIEEDIDHAQRLISIWFGNRDVGRINDAGRQELLDMAEHEGCPLDVMGREIVAHNTAIRSSDVVEDIRTGRDNIQIEDDLDNYILRNG